MGELNGENDLASRIASKNFKEFDLFCKTYREKFADFLLWVIIFLILLLIIINL